MHKWASLARHGLQRGWKHAQRIGPQQTPATTHEGS